MSLNFNNIKSRLSLLFKGLWSLKEYLRFAEIINHMVQLLYLYIL